MPRIRSVKPEFWTDEDLADLRRDARLLYVGLWNFADEHGRLRGDPRYIKGQIFPYDDDLTPEAIDSLLEELSGAGKVRRYRVAGRSYLFLPNLASHQRLEAEKVPSRLPGLDEAEPDADEPKPSSPAATDGAHESAPGADSSSLLYGTGSMGQGAGSREVTRAGAGADARERPAPAQAPRPDGLTTIPDDFALTDAMRRTAASTFPQLDVDFETAQFISHYRSTGARRRNWPEQWTKWMRDSAKRLSERALRAAPAARPATTDARVAQAQALKALYADGNQPGTARPPTIRGEITR